MFETGKSYTIRLWEDGEEGATLADYDNCEVNTASLAFVQATLETDEEAASEE